MKNEGNSVNRNQDKGFVLGSSDKKKYVNRECTDPEMDTIFNEFRKANEDNFPHGERTLKISKIDPANIVNGVDVQKMKQEADKLFHDFEKKNKQNFPTGKSKTSGSHGH